MAITALQGPRDDTGYWLQFASMMASLGERKKTRKLEERRLSLVEKELGMKEEMFPTAKKAAEAQAITATTRAKETAALSPQKIAVAQLELGNTMRWLKATKNLPSRDVTARQQDELLYKTYTQYMNSGDQDKINIAVEGLSKGAISRMQNQTLQSQGAELNLLKSALAVSQQDLNTQKFAYQQLKDETTRTFNLFLGDGADAMEDALGEEQFKVKRTEALSQLAGERMRRTPHDYGWANFEKQPREPLSFRTAHTYWLRGNITDEEMWLDWGDELTREGYVSGTKTKRVITPDTTATEEILKQDLTEAK